MTDFKVFSLMVRWGCISFPVSDRKMDFFFFFTRLENEEHSFPDYVPTDINSLSSKLLITTCLKDSLEKGNLNKGTFSITINYRLIFEVWDRLVMEGKLRTKKCIVGSSSKCEGGGREKKKFSLICIW